jgi:hypothetical protein
LIYWTTAADRIFGPQEWAVVPPLAARLGALGIYLLGAAMAGELEPRPP